MKVILHALIFLLLLPGNANSQVFKKIKYQAEAGLGISVGANTFGIVESEINPLTVQYYKHKRYHAPTVRIRGFAYKPLNDKMHLGLKTGIDVHYLERNVYGEYETNLSVPLQFFSEIKALHFNHNSSVYAGAGFGWNLKSLSHEPFTEKTGILASFEVSLNRRLMKRTFYYKAGFEYGEEKCSYQYVPGDPSWKEETIKYKQHRKQVHATVGINL